MSEMVILEKAAKILEKHVPNRYPLKNRWSDAMIEFSNLQLKEFIEWYNKEYPVFYIPNSRLGRYLKQLE